jgi:outer membrane biosynthesis protein TonB
MPLIPTPTENESSTTPEETSRPENAAEVRLRVGRYGEMAADELIHLIDSIDTERERARFRESLYISLFVWIVVAWFVFYGPRMLWHAPPLINPADVLKQRELTELTAPVLPKMSAPAARPPVIDEKTMSRLKEMAKAPPAPAPVAPAPAPTQPAPMTSAPATPPPPPAPSVQPRTAPPVVAEAPTVQPTRPNFGSQPSAGDAIKNALEGAARNRNTGGGYDTGGRRSGPLNVGGAEVLSDTQGVDFGPYLRHVLSDIKRNWDPLIPPEAQPPLLKQGEAWVRFTILPDGSIGGMHLDGSTHDEAINKSCWGSITSEGQFPPLPSQFKGPNLELRIHYLVNKPLE